MKLIVDIPDDDYTSIRCEELYYFGQDKLAESVTTAFQTAIPYEEKAQSEWVTDELCRLRSCLRSGLHVGSYLQTQNQMNRFIAALDEVIPADTER